MKIIPLYKDDIERCVANFHLYSDEIRMNIPDVILATMEALHAKFKKIKAERKTSFIPSEGVHPEVVRQVCILLEDECLNFLQRLLYREQKQMTQNSLFLTLVSDAQERF